MTLMLVRHQNGTDTDTKLAEFFAIMQRKGHMQLPSRKHPGSCYSNVCAIFVLFLETKN